MPRLSLLLAGGFLALAAAMGVGRFFYTPMLPLMQAAEGFGPDTAGLIASVNFLGYFLGSLAAALVPHRHALAAQRGFLVLGVLAVLGMGLSRDVATWLVLRGLSGLASALTMILTAGIVVETLARHHREALVGLFWGGVGFGITASGLLAEFGQAALDWRELWIAAGLCTALAVPVVWVGLAAPLPPRPAAAAPAAPAAAPFPFVPLLLAYLLEGLGYSVFATFIVAIAKARPGLEAVADEVWIVVGLAALPSCLLWAAVGQRIGLLPALVLAFLAQIAGVLLPVLSGGAAAAFLAAVLFGGTFMGITLLAVPLGRGAARGRGIALLTAAFGLGQIAGPLLAGAVAASRGYGPGLTGSAAALAGAVALLLLGAVIRRRG